MNDSLTVAVRKIKRSRAVQATRRTQQSAAAFRRGFADAKGMELTTPSVVEREGSSSLEAYFDAHTEGPGLWKWRHYFDIYERHLAKFRGKPVRMLEIGVFGGGSMSMWREYLGTECHIYGVDIDPSCKAYEDERTTIFIGDQSDPELWAKVVRELPEIDIVLDDGGHQAFQQIPTFEALFPKIAAGGVFICEDIHGPGHPFHSFIDGFTRPLSDIPIPAGKIPATPCQQQVSSVHRYPLVTVVEKPGHVVRYFEAPRRGSIWPEGRQDG